MTDIASSRLPEIRVPGLLTLGGLVAGLLSGLALAGTSALQPALSIAGPIGALWLKGLQMTILPLVVGLLFTGVIETAAAARAGQMARYTLSWFAGLLAFSAVVGGVGMAALLRLFPAAAMARPAGVSGSDAPLPQVSDFVSSLLPSNVLASASEGAMLPVIVFAALFALATARLDEAPRRHLATLFQALAHAMIVVIGWVLRVAPLGVFALGLSLAATSGAAALGALAHYIVLISTVGAVFLLLAYPVAAVAGRQPLSRFARAVLPAQVVAVSTQSSLASLPTMLASCRTLGLRTPAAEFVLPLAVTLFRVTSPAMNMGVCVYAAQLAGHPLSAAAIAAGALVAFVTTFGTVSLPGTISFIASTGPIAAAMGVPLWPLAVLVAVEMLPDIMRTIANVTMDLAVTGAVDRSLGEGSDRSETRH